jgi:hypothetical protein
LKLFQESGEKEWEREVEEGNSSMIYLIHCKNLCKCCNVLHPAQKLNEKDHDVFDPQYTFHVLHSCLISMWICVSFLIIYITYVLYDFLILQMLNWFLNWSKAWWTSVLHCHTQNRKNNNKTEKSVEILKLPFCLARVTNKFINF